MRQRKAKVPGEMEPWEIFLESFHHGAPKLDVTAPWEEVRERGKEILEGAGKAQESLLWHLVESKRWRLPEAKALAWEFVEATVDWMKMKDQDDSLTLADALRNQWTDWVLRKGY